MTKIFTSLLALALITISCAKQTKEQAEVNTHWTKTIVLQNIPDSISKNLLPNVKYIGPGGMEISGLAYFHSGDSLVFRCMFPEKGKWTWQLRCENQECSTIIKASGEVDVTEYSGENKLYKYGYPKVVKGDRYLKYANGKPFLWIGDTGWAAIFNSTYDEWCQYINNRKDNGFTVVQVACASDWASKNKTPETCAFESNDITKLNNSYWDDYQQKIQYANEQGIVVFIVGLMEPSYRYPKTIDAILFSRQLVARLMGNHVIFSPAFDSHFTVQTLADSVAAAIGQASSLHLVTQHSNSVLETAEIYLQKDYIEFLGIQTGAGWYGKNFQINADTAARYIFEWSPKIYNGAQKPFINTEARYDNEFTQNEMPRLPRSCAYWSILNGSAGYTHGCAGLWNWGVKSGVDPQGDEWSWQKGIAQKSTAEMKYLSEFMSSINWFNLVPASDLIKNQPQKWTQKIACAVSSAESLLVAYLPDNEQIQIEVITLVNYKSARWFNPSYGSNLIFDISDSKSSGTFTKPANWEDAILVLN
jgi:hypothetical protein